MAIIRDNHDRTKGRLIVIERGNNYLVQSKKDVKIEATKIMHVENQIRIFMKESTGKIKKIFVPNEIEVKKV